MRFATVSVFMLPLALAACGQRSKTPATSAALPPWQADDLPTDAEFWGLCFTDSLNGWAAGGGYFIEGGIVGRTHDGGRTWSFTNLLPGNRGRRSGLYVRGMVFLDSERGLAATDVGVYLTSDGGDFWRTTRPSGRNVDPLLDLQLLDGRRGWAAGRGGILETADGGESWNLLAQRDGDLGGLSPTAVHFVDASRGVVVGLHGRASRTVDGGRTWTPLALDFDEGAHPRLYDVEFIDADHGWIVGDGAHLFATRDGGTTWTRQREGVPVFRPVEMRPDPPRTRDVVPEIETEPSRLCLSAVEFADAQRGWAVGFYHDAGESIVLGTWDGGKSWTVERTLPGEELRALFVLDHEHAWAAGARVRPGTHQILRYRPARN